jgi:hypothetical protein
MTHDLASPETEFATSPVHMPSRLLFEIVIAENNPACEDWESEPYE